MSLSLDKSKIKILLLEGVNQSAVDLLKKDGYENIDEQPALSPDELKEAIKGVHILGHRSKTQITPELLEHADRLMAIGVFGIGTNKVDLKACAEKGIPVFNAPFSSTRSVAELAIGNIFALLRATPAKNMGMHRGEWPKSPKGAHEIRGKTLGVIGYSNIGVQVALAMESLGMEVVYYDVEKKLALGNARAAKSLDELLEVSDVVTIHVPGMPATMGLIGKEQIAKMKPGARIINTSRGGIIDEVALKAALESGHIAGAALDVFEKEPKAKTDPFESPFIGMDNVYMTPHIGGSTEEAQANIGNEVVEKFIKYSDNGSSVQAVNFPQVNLPEYSDRNRILHIHNNQPGVLGCVNEVLSKHKLNVAGQYLQTAGDIGYVVVDVDKTDSIPLDELRAVEGTIRARVLY